MSNFIIGWINQVMAGPVTVSSAEAAMGPEQLQNDQGSPSTAWQTPAGQTTGAVLLVRVPGTPWRLFGLHNTNLTPAATVTWNVLNGSAASYVGQSAPVTAGYGQAVHVAPADFYGDRMQVNISDPSNPDGFLNIPQMFAGTGLQPLRNYAFASSPSRTTKGITTALRAGGAIIRTDWTKRTFDLSLAGIRSSEMPEFLNLDATVRQGANALFVPTPDNPVLTSTEAIFGQVEPSSGFTYPNSNPFTRGWRALITERL